MRQSGDVHLDHARIRIPIGFREGAQQTESGVIDQDIDGANRRENRLRRSGVGQIDGERPRGDPVFACKAAREVFQLIAAPRHQNDIIARGRAQLGQFQPDAAGRPGNQRRGSSHRLFLLLELLIVILDELPDLIAHAEQLLPLFTVKSDRETS